MSKYNLSKKFNVPKSDHEEYLREVGSDVICGVDEVGRGSWAGPLVAAAVVLNRRLYGLRDSKLLTSNERAKLAQKIKKTSDWGIGVVSVKELNRLKLTKGTQLAFKRAIYHLEIKCDFILSDAFRVDLPIPCRAIIKGDRFCSSIAAASIIAKEYRDKIMCDLDEKYPGYGFAIHKGYGTKYHKNRLEELGVTKIHRGFYKSIKN